MGVSLVHFGAAIRSRGFLVAVILIPLLQLLQSLASLYRLPAFWRFYADPPYMYLFNSLSLGTGLTPQHVDHPGTSLQWLMAGVEHVTFLASGSEDSLPSDIAGDPEKYLTVTGVVLALLFAASVAFFLWRVLHYVGQASAFAAGLLILAASGLTVPWIVTATPEALVASCAVTILAILMPSLVRRSSPLGWRAWVAIGVLMAIGVTAKITMLPLAILFLFVVRIRGLFAIAGTTVLAAALILVPVYELLPRMFGWFTNLARSSGRYGGDSPTSVTSNFLAGLETVTRDYGLTWIVLGLFAVLLVVSLRQRSAGIDWSHRIPALGVAATVLATIAVSFKESTDRDFILLVGLVPTLGALATAWINALILSAPEHRRRRFETLGVACLVTLAIVAVALNFRSFAEIQDINERSDAEVAILDEASRRDGLVAHSFLAQNEFFALMLGSEWAYHPYSDRILDRFPDNLYFNAFLSTVFGKRSDGSIGYLDCGDIGPAAESGTLTFVLPGDFSVNGNRATPGEIALADGSVVTFDTTSVEVFGDRLSAVPISGCIPPQ